MAWFVARLGPAVGPCGSRRLFLHGHAYSSQAAAEAVAWDNARLINAGHGPVDETVPPYIVEADDERSAVSACFTNLAGSPRSR